MAAHPIAEPGQARKQSGDGAPRAWVLLAVLPVLLQLALSLLHLKASWDDGAITAAFSRTWAQTGRIALTPGSPVVEGYSSLSWFALLAAPMAVTANPDAVLVWMKICAAVFALLTLWIFYRVAARQLQQRSSAQVATLLLACCFPMLQEIRTGMEMNLVAFLLLAIFYVATAETVRARWPLLCALGVLLVLARFEIPFTIIFLIAGLALAATQRQNRFGWRQVLLLTTVLVVAFASTELWRHHVFGLWMPNTVSAKRFAPYRDWTNLHSALLTRYHATTEVMHVLGLPLFGTAALAAYAAVRGRLSAACLRRVHPAVYTLAFAALCFGIVFGQNWGSDGRMIAGVVPFVLLAVAGVCECAVPPGIGRTAVWSLFLAGQGALWLYFALHPVPNISIAEIERIGLGAEQLRVALGEPRLQIMLPDVGGSTLCCARLDVLDSALLTDPTLARTGWAGFDAYFRQTHPQVVETHNVWARVTNIYRSGLLDGYSIVSADGERYFVRNDLYAHLLQGRSPVPVGAAPGCLAGADEADRAFSLLKGTCLVLSQPDVPSSASR